MYVIDTGIRITHADFGGRASYGPDFVDDDDISADCEGHGTHVAGTVGSATYGVAKNVNLVASVSSTARAPAATPTSSRPSTMSPSRQGGESPT
ncbi:MAG: S8 family serine peptidase [Gemmatimonadota bacterium]|nr:S8 family serine peptidase [Gemmatimonadota bacterium]